MKLQEFVINHNLNNTEKSIIFYLYEHVSDNKKLPIRFVALKTFTSTGYIFNFAKKIGFDGYAEMLFYLKNLKKIDNTAFYHNNNELSFNFLMSNINDYVNRFTNLIEKYQDKKIFLFGFGYSNITAQYIQDKLLYKGYNINITSHLQVVFNDDSLNKHLIIVISESGYNNRLLEIVQSAQEHNLEIISFTANQASPIAQISTLALPINCYDNPLSFTNTFAPFTMIYFDYLLKYLQ